MADLTPYISVANQYMQGIAHEFTDPREAFAQELLRAGFKFNSHISMNGLQRCDAPGDKPGKKSGWYVYTEVADASQENKIFAVGVYGSWRGDPEKVTWTSKPVASMTAQERMHHTAQIEAANAKRDAEMRIRQSEAAVVAAEEWAKAAPAPSEHAYLVKKQVPALELRVLDGDLLVPVMVDGQITSLQKISSDGSKRFLTGGRTKGCYYTIKGSGDFVYVTEGWATAASIHLATKATVYVAFSAHNLYETTSKAIAENPTKKVVIAADDDRFTEVNAGRKYASQASQGLSVPVVFPDFIDLLNGTDFNDLHAAEGLYVVKQQLEKSAEVIPFEYKQDVGGRVDLLAPTHGVLKDLYNYYMATSGNHQPGFAIQTALAICSIVTARAYKTNKENYSSLYLLNVGKSSTGKEHAKTVIEKVLLACSMDELVNGDGYTSGGGVFSSLLYCPRHISVIDEFGRHLEAGSSLRGGDHHRREANTKLMEAIGRCHTVMRPPSYSTMNLTKEAQSEMRARKIYQPAITLLAMTTPVTLFKTLDMGAIKDGFINRFIMSISDAERAVRNHKDVLEVPENIKTWARTIEARAHITHIATEEAPAVTLTFNDDAIKLQTDFQEYCIDLANRLEKYDMSELTGRSNEMAMRVALICALAENPMADIINSTHMSWAIEYVRHCLERTIDCLKMNLSSSQFEADKKEVLSALRKNSPCWMKVSDMIKTPPYSKHNKKALQEILESLVEAGLIEERFATGSRGRPSKEYIAV